VGVLVDGCSRATSVTLPEADAAPQLGRFGTDLGYQGFCQGFCQGFDVLIRSCASLGQRNISKFCNGLSKGCPTSVLLQKGSKLKKYDLKKMGPNLSETNNSTQISEGKFWWFCWPFCPIPPGPF